jgi:hypothetical protein
VALPKKKNSAERRGLKKEDLSRKKRIQKAVNSSKNRHGKEYFSGII